MAFSFSTKKFTKLIPKRHPGFYAVNPQRDWKRIVVGFLAIVLISLAIHGYIFWKINKGEIFLANGVNEENVQTIDRTKLKQLMDYYDSREARLAGLHASTTPMRDPSL